VSWPVTRFASNGCDWLTITLLDVLSGFDTLQVCTRYELDPEQDLALFETGVRLGFHVPGVREPSRLEGRHSGETRWDSLPENARRYVLAVEKARRCVARQGGIHGA
jgi:adenylosuccinate synthase